MSETAVAGKNRQGEEQKKKLQKEEAYRAALDQDLKRGGLSNTITDSVEKGMEESLFKIIQKCFSKERNDPVSSQDTIKYKKITKDGICQLDDTHYNKTIRFSDINYQLAHNDAKRTIFGNYCGFLNYFDPTVKVQMTFVNELVNIEEEKKRIDIEEQEDEVNDIRVEYRDYLREQLAKGNNGLKRHKYVTYTIEAKNEMLAKAKLARVETDIQNNFKIMGVRTEVLNGSERLELMHNILNTNEKPFDIDWSEVKEKKTNTKDYICPKYFDFRDKNIIRMGKKYACFQHVMIIAPQIEDRFLAELLDMNSEMVVTIDFETMEQQKAVQLVKNKIGALEAMKSDVQKKAVQGGYDMDTLPPELRTNLTGAQNLLQDLQGHNERYFTVSMYITNIAPTRTKLQNDIFQAQSIVQKYNCELKMYDYAGEEGLNSMLPLGMNRMFPNRGLTTSSLGILIPFTTQELFQSGQSLYYGLNALSNNMIMADRKRLKNPNGLILGVPGAGKSFSAKREMINVYLTTHDDIIISDPEGEYGFKDGHPGLIQKLAGQEIVLSPNSKTYLNPLDITEDYSEDEDPLQLKADEVMSIMELVIASKDGLTPRERSIINRCTLEIYKPWKADPTPENIPILEDLHNALMAEGSAEAIYLADGLWLYVYGSLNYFNHRTNVEITNRIVSYNIKELGKQLKKFAMLVVEDQIWNRVSHNRGIRGKYTWVYLDEFHLLLRDEQTSAFSVEIWKRLRKWQGIPTGITQNVKDFLTSMQVESIFENSNFYYLLSQAPGDKEFLADKLSISQAQLSYIENSAPGEGLIIYNDTILPFVDHFPKDTKMYQLLNTQPADIK